MDKGVANSSTYKNTYYFTDDFKKIGDEFPSIKDEDKINHIIRENPYRSNVNIEKGEIILQPDLSALFKASGKKHYNGGIDVYLKPESFVFSDHKDLAFDEDDHKLMELKQGGNFNKNNNTPAKVLNRNIDVKHYNTLVNNITDPKKDDLSKTTSVLMLGKYIKNLGNIAVLQEGKKNFPDGIPFFAQDSVPIYDNQVKENIMESKQYAKYGGNINNPYMQAGGTKKEYNPPYKPPTPSGYGTIEQLKKQLAEYNNLTGNNVPLDYQGLLQARRDVINNYPEFVKYYYQSQKIPINNSLYRKNQSLSGYSIDELLSNYEDLPQGAKDPLYGNELIDYKKIEFETQGALDNFVKGKNPIYRGSEIIGYDDPERKGRFYIPSVWKGNSNGNRLNPSSSKVDSSNVLRNSNVPKTNIANVGDKPIHPNSVNITPSKQESINWQFTPWQKISQLHNLGQVANVKRYMPYRSRYNATYIEPSLLNPEQAVGDAKGASYQSIQALNTLSPILRNAQAASIYGNELNTIPGIRSQYDNQNSQIINQSRQYNNQVRNNESMVNMQNDQNYYQQSVTGRANFDNMRSFLGNNAMNNIMRDVETNQKLAYNMAALNNPAYGFDFKSGNFYRNPKSILDIQSLAPQETFQNMVEEVQKMKSSGLSDQVISALIRGQFFKQAAPYFSQSSGPVYKKGGKINPYK